MTYSLEFKTSRQLFWRRVKNIKGDFIANDTGTPTRVLILNDECRVEIPLVGTEFRFSKERYFSIKSQMEKEARQPIQTG